MTEQIGDQKTVTTETAAGRKSASTSVVAPASAPAPSPASVPASAPAATAPSGPSRAAAPAPSSDSVPSPASTPASAPAAAYDTRHAVLRYTTLRLALFLVALLIVWGVATVFNMDLSSQLSKLTLLAVALLLSSAASFIVLSRYRDAMSAGIVARTERLSRKFDDAAAFEDEDDDD